MLVVGILNSGSQYIVEEAQEEFSLKLKQFTECWKFYLLNTEINRFLVTFFRLSFVLWLYNKFIKPSKNAARYYCVYSLSCTLLRNTSSFLFPGTAATSQRSFLAKCNQIDIVNLPADRRFLQICICIAL